MKAVFIDIETNGLDPEKHVALEIALMIVDIQTSNILEAYSTLIRCPESEWDDSDEEALDFNGIKWDDVCSAKQVKDCSKQIKKLFEKHEIKVGTAFFIAQNPSFDRAFFSQLISVQEQHKLQWPYHWLDLASMFWIKLMEPAMQKTNKYTLCSLSKDSIALGLGLSEEQRPHRAATGVEHLKCCYDKICAFSHDISRESKAMEKFEHVPIMNPPESFGPEALSLILTKELKEAEQQQGFFVKKIFHLTQSIARLDNDEIK